MVYSKSRAGKTCVLKQIICIASKVCQEVMARAAYLQCTPCGAMWIWNPSGFNGNLPPTHTSTLNVSAYGIVKYTVHLNAPMHQLAFSAIMPTRCEAVPALLTSARSAKRRTQFEQLYYSPYVTYSCGWNIPGSSHSSPSCVKCGPRCRARRWPPLAARACNPLWEMLRSVGSGSSCFWPNLDDCSHVPTHYSLCCSSSRRTGG